MSDKIQAADCTCIEKDCTRQAVAFWPVVDPDIPSYPYCRQCLDAARMKMLILMHDEGFFDPKGAE